ALHFAFELHVVPAVALHDVAAGPRDIRIALQRLLRPRDVVALRAGSRERGAAALRIRRGTNADSECNRKHRTYTYRHELSPRVVGNLAVAGTTDACGASGGPRSSSARTM